MTSKNSPVRIIDQRGVGLAKNPAASTTKYNPYTGATIQTTESKSYGVWLQSSGTGITRTIAISISDTDTRKVFIQVKIPDIIVRLDNPTFTLERIKLFFAFTETQFNKYLESQYFLGNDDNLDKIVTLDTTSVLSLNRTSTQGTLQVNTHIARLFQKHTLADLVLLTNSISSVDGLSSDDLLRLFKANTSRLQLFCQVGFQDLVPLRAGKQVPYVKRTNATIQFTFSDERLTADTLFNIRFSVEGTKKYLEFTKTSIKTLEYSVYTMNPGGFRVKIHSGTITPSPAQDQIKFLINYPTAIINYSWVSRLVGFEYDVLNELQKYSRQLSISIDRVVTDANVSYTGATLQARYGINEFYAADISAENFVKPFTRYPIKYDFANKRRTIIADPNGSPADVVGFAIVYTLPSQDGGLTYPAVVHYVPKTMAVVDNVQQYIIADSFTDNTLGSTALTLQRITVYTLLQDAHLGNVVVQVNSPPRIRLQKYIQTETANRGYFFNTIALSRDKNSIVFNQFGQRDNNLEVVLDFSLVVQRFASNRWTTLTNGTIQCKMRYNASYNGVLIYNARNALISSVSIAALTSAKGRYRVLAVPRLVTSDLNLVDTTDTLATGLEFIR